MVRLRYADHGAFHDVGQVFAGYQIEGVLGTGTNFGNHIDLGDDFQLYGESRYIERPTITWQPVTGASSSKRLLQPLPPGVLTEFPPDMEFGLTVNTINGLGNGSTRPGESIPPHPRWETVIERLRVMRSLGLLGISPERYGLGRPEPAALRPGRREPRHRPPSQGHAGAAGAGPRRQRVLDGLRALIVAGRSG